MRLYAYADRLGVARTGVLTDSGLLTARQLSRYLDDPDCTSGSPSRRLADPAWQADVERAARTAAETGVEPKNAARRHPLPAVWGPEKIVGIGLNFADHARENGREAPGAHEAGPDADEGHDAPQRPLTFAKFANAIIADGETIVQPPGTDKLDLEVELGVVIGRRARRVPPERAMGHVAGYVVVNDVSARDWQGKLPALAEGQRGDGQWLRAKGSDTFLPVGPVLVTPDELDPAAGLRLRSWIIREGEEILMQDGTTGDLLVDVPHLVSLISQEITLEPGDLVITGTPAGVGVFRQPPVFLRPGDRVRCEVEGIGSVENPVADWTDDPRRGA